MPGVCDISQRVSLDQEQVRIKPDCDESAPANSKATKLTTTASCDRVKDGSLRKGRGKCLLVMADTEIIYPIAYSACAGCEYCNTTAD
jgi:hypothetical protein